MTVVDCIADLHGHYPKLEGGDLLIVAGDWTKKDTISEIEDFEDWLLSQAYKKIILIAGNHDNVVNECGWVDKGKIEYLLDSGTEFEGLKIWGSPWTKTFGGMNPKCKAFTLETDEELAEKWALIPKDTDILITHSPPYDILDEVDSQEHCTSYHVGSISLLQRVCVIKPRLHVFGHVHEGYGEFKIRNWKELRIEDAGITQYIKDSNFVNASYTNELYEPVNKPIRVIL